jgi:hypothetical protein
MSSQTSVQRPRSPPWRTSKSACYGRWAATGTARWAQGEVGCARCRSIPRCIGFPVRWKQGAPGRFAPIDFVEADDDDEIVATRHAAAGASSAGRAASMFRRVLLGAPLNASAVAHERMRTSVAIPILSSDALSSVAYGPEAMLAVLALAGNAALGVSLRLSRLFASICRGWPYRALVAPPACYIDALRKQRVDLTLTVVVPELIVTHRWHQLLHTGTARGLRRAVRRQPGVVITTVPVHVPT